MYRPADVIQFYRVIGDREWRNLEEFAYDRLVFELVGEILRPYVSGGKRVLDAGCGAGLFSVQAAEAGAALSLVDLCPEQVARAFEALKQRGLADRVETCVVADVLDLSIFPDSSFDTAICLGGVLGYLGQFASKGLHELIRVTREGGAILMSVLSRCGGLRFSFANEDVDLATLMRSAKTIATGGDDVPPPGCSHPPRHFFTSSELSDLLTQAGVHSFELRSIPVLAGGVRTRVECTSKSPESWESLLSVEKIASQMPGVVDAGEHLIAEIYPLTKLVSAER